jgi:hypothetical protein
MSPCINFSSTVKTPISTVSTALLPQSLYIYIYFLLKMVDFYNYKIIIVINYNLSCI